MNQVTPEAVRSLILSHLQFALAERGLTAERIDEDFDLLTEGVVDSQGILELILAMEGCLGVQIDFEEMDPGNLTIVGPFCRYVSERCAQGNKPMHHGFLME